ncbi:MAG: redoxin domain-containing protein [Chitinophagales bacterium]|nr:redoxin domain-containing protein [Chitinophagales bacterium]
MKYRIFFLLFIELFISCSKKESKQPIDIFSLTLNSLDHNSYSLDELSKRKGAVIVFLQPECPFCNSYGKTLKQLDSICIQKRISFLGIVSGKNYSEAEIKTYLDKHHLTNPILLDPDFTLQKQLGATITPEAFLINNKGKMLYRGMIDNWGYEIGKVRAHVSDHYLLDAIEAYLQNKPIAPDSTKAIGCYIE